MKHDTVLPTPDSGSATVYFRSMKLKNVKPGDSINFGIKVLSIRKGRDHYYMTVTIGSSKLTSNLSMPKKAKVRVSRRLDSLDKDQLELLVNPTDTE